MVKEKCSIYLLTLMVLFLLNSTNVVHALQNEMDQYIVLNKLHLMSGDWYNDDGDIVLSINDKYINGCAVLSAYDFVGASNFGSGYFHILESTGVRTLKIGWKILGQRGDYVTVNDSQMLHRTKEYFYESVAGVHLGMSSYNVEHQWGKPDLILSDERSLKIGNKLYREGWYYKDKSVIVRFESNGVCGITIFKNSNLHLDKSGLNCSDSPVAFEKFYKLETPYGWKNPFQYPNVCLSIGYSEYISFSENMESVLLTVYFN